MLECYQPLFRLNSQGQRVGLAPAIARLALVPALLVGVSAEALAARSDWAVADQSQMRLLLSELKDGRIEGGLEIVLEPGWHTYWRNPGEAGVPPVFDFSGSENVADVHVLFPAPERHDDGASVSLVYYDEVVFPLTVTPRDRGAPVTLRVEAAFGVCSEVCIPTSASTHLTALPDAPTADPLTDARLAAFRPRVPSAPERGRLDIEEVRAEEDSLLIDVLMPDSSYSELFADPPAGWYVGQPVLLSRENGVSRYRLPLEGRPDDVPLAGQVFTFVAVAGGESIEEAVTIE